MMQSKTYKKGKDPVKRSLEREYISQNLKNNLALTFEDALVGSF